MKPYQKAQKVPYVGLQDRRRKLTDAQRAEILKLRQETGAGYRAIARRFGVSRSLVRFICDPEAAQRCRDRIAATWRVYRDRRGKEENARIQRDFKNRKYKMFMRGELSEKYTPPPPRSKIATRTIKAILPDGKKIDVRLPVSFIEGEGDGVHVGRVNRTERRDGKFYVTKITH